MIVSSEEHRNAEGALQIVRRLFLTEDVDVEQVVAKIDMQRDAVVQQEPEARTEIDVYCAIGGGAVNVRAVEDFSPDYFAEAETRSLGNKLATRKSQRVTLGVIQGSDIHIDGGVMFKVAFPRT